MNTARPTFGTSGSEVTFQGERVASVPEADVRVWLEAALEVGFDRAATVTLQPSEYEEPVRGFVKRGDHAEMAWFERSLDVRLDPRRVFERVGTAQGRVARGALCVALHYPHDPRDPGEVASRTARYARGLDYHDTLGERLKQLEARISAQSPGLLTRRYTDTGPLLERELAQRAGLGRIGKNTMLLSPWGSYFLLGEILVDRELPPLHAVRTPFEERSDSAEALSQTLDMCGNCTRCLDACPTGALPEPFRLDARRCLSYLTIEHRGGFDAEQLEAFGDHMGQWLFGCDICQAVCPWNETRPLDGGHQEFKTPAQRRSLDLVTLVRMSHAEYVEVFRKSPMKRAKLPGLKRNAVAAMAALGDVRYVEALVDLVRSSEEPPWIAEQARKALSRMASGGLEEAAAALTELSGQNDP